MMKSQGYLWVDIEGTTLSQEDKELLAHPSVLGVVIFSRNFESLQQCQKLTSDILSISSKLMVIVDQEGGRIQRFREGFTELPAMAHWGREFQTSPKKTIAEFNVMLSKMVQELRAAGIYSSLVPVLDINHQRSKIIGERSFSDQPLVVSHLGKVMIDCLHQLKMPVTAKHFPGHGFVSADSHESLPVDDRNFAEIAATDLKPFAALAPKYDALMPAHIVYSQCDDLPAGFSPYWLQTVLRGQLRFDGLIMSDDLTMQGAAMIGDYEDRARAALEAGCDVLLVCNSREGVIQILDSVKKSQNSDSQHRIARYGRFLL